jgi:putative Mg2+ transporter-C (MgtC) family protein
MGSALFTSLSINLPFIAESQRGIDVSRIAAQIVIGISFLGGGVIMFRQSHIQGLTTAATMWMVAAIGMAVGAGWYLLSILVALLTFIVLDLLSRLRTWEEKILSHEDNHNPSNGS